MIFKHWMLTTVFLVLVGGVASAQETAFKNDGMVNGMIGFSVTRLVCPSGGKMLVDFADESQAITKVTVRIDGRPTGASAVAMPRGSTNELMTYDVSYNDDLTRIQSGAVTRSGKPRRYLFKGLSETEKLVISNQMAKVKEAKRCCDADGETRQMCLGIFNPMTNDGGAGQRAEEAAAKKKAVDKAP